MISRQAYGLRLDSGALVSLQRGQRTFSRGSGHWGKTTSETVPMVPPTRLRMPGPECRNTRREVGRPSAPELSFEPTERASQLMIGLRWLSSTPHGVISIPVPAGACFAQAFN